MNSLLPNSFASRPTYTRQVSDASSLEMARLQERPPAVPLGDQARRGSAALSTDIFARNPSLSGPSTGPHESPRGSTAYEQGPIMGVPQPGILGARNRPPLVRVPSRLARAMSFVGHAVAAHWRDLTVGGVLTGVVSWAIWATVKINRATPDIPYCVFEDPSDL